MNRKAMTAGVVLLLAVTAIGYSVARTSDGVHRKIRSGADPDPYEGAPQYEADVISSNTGLMEVVTETIGTQVTVETRWRSEPCEPPAQCFVAGECHCPHSVSYPWTWYRSGWFGQGGWASYPCSGHPMSASAVIGIMRPDCAFCCKDNHWRVKVEARTCPGAGEVTHGRVRTGLCDCGEGGGTIHKCGKCTDFSGGMLQKDPIDPLLYTWSSECKYSLERLHSGFWVDLYDDDELVPALGGVRITYDCCDDTDCPSCP